MGVHEALNATLLRARLLERALNQPHHDHWQISLCGDLLDARVTIHSTGVTFVAGCGELPEGDYPIGLYLNGTLVLTDEIHQGAHEGEIDISLSLLVAVPAA